MTDARNASAGGPRHLVGRVAGAVTGRVVEAIDPDQLLDQVDVERLLDRIDPNALLDRVDVNQVLDRVDVNRLLDRVEVDRLLDRVDVNRLLDRVDVDQLLARADVEAVVRRSGVPDLVASSTGQIAGSLLDLARRQAAGVDTLLDRTVDRALRRRPEPARVAPPALRTTAAGVAASGRIAVTGQYAGVLSRALALVADAAIATASFTLAVAGVRVLDEAFLDVGLSTDTTRPLGIASWVVWAFLYSWLSLSLAGRTPGKALVGLRVVRRTGVPLGPGRALVRTLVEPASAVVGGLGFALALVHPQHRTLHDVAAGTAVVYDWGDRPAELPGPLSAYLSRHSAATG